MQHAAAEKAIERYVKETRAKADLGILSNEAAALERKVEYSTSPVERAEAEAKLAELETHRQSIIRQTEHDEKVKERLAKLRVAVAKYPKNHLLRKRLKNMLALEDRERRQMAHVVKSGDRCAPCRTRVMGVMEGALNSGVLTKDLPEYMRSFCEIRLSQGGNPLEPRSRDSITRVCGKFQTALKRNLDESAAVQEGQIKSDEKDIVHDGSRRSKDDHHVIPARRKMSDDYGHTAAVHDYCIATSECIPSDKVHATPGPRDMCERCASQILGAVDTWKRAGIVDTAQLMSAKISQYCVSRLNKSWRLGKELIRDTCSRAMDMDGAPIFAPSVVEQVDQNAQNHRDLEHAFGFCSAVGECPKKQPIPDIDPKVMVQKQKERERIIKIDKAGVANAVQNVNKCKNSVTSLREALQKQRTLPRKCETILGQKKSALEDFGANMEKQCATSRSHVKDMEAAQGEHEENRHELVELQKKVEEKTKECKIMKDDRAAHVEQTKVSAKTKFETEAGRINAELADVDQKIRAQGGESVGLTTRKEQLEKAMSQAEERYKNVVADLSTETKAMVTKCATEKQSYVAAVNTAANAVQTSFQKLNALHAKLDASDKQCKDALNEKSTLEAAVSKQGKKCSIASEELSKSRKEVAVARAKCDGMQVTKDMEMKQLSILDDDMSFTATGAGSTGASGSTGVVASPVDQSLPTSTGESGPEMAPVTTFPRTVGDCSLGVLGHLDKVRQQTQRNGVWPVMSKWAWDICRQMASSAAYKKELNTNVNVACSHARSVFAASSNDNDVRRSEKFCRTVQQFVVEKPEGPLYTRQPLLPVAPAIRPSKSELLYIFSPGAQVNPKYKRTLENPATDELKISKRNGHEAGHYYKQLANHLAMEEAVNKTKTPQDLLIAKMESSFAAKWKAKQKRMGIKFGPVPEEEDDFTNILSAKNKTKIVALRTSTGGATGMVKTGADSTGMEGKGAGSNTTVAL